MIIESTTQTFGAGKALTLALVCALGGLSGVRGVKRVYAERTEPGVTAPPWWRMRVVWRNGVPMAAAAIMFLTWSAAMVTLAVFDWTGADMVAVLFAVLVLGGTGYFLVEAVRSSVGKSYLR